MLEKIKKMYPEKCIVITPYGSKSLINHKDKYPKFSKHYLGNIFLDDVLVYDKELNKFAEVFTKLNT